MVVARGVGEVKMKEELWIYGTGIIYSSVCTNIESRERIEELVNIRNPSGISSEWKISKDLKFATGENNPSPCDQKPDTHQHYLMSC